MDPREFGAAANLLGLALPDDRLSSLARFSDLLVQRAVALGLVAEGDRERIVERHVSDCLRAASLVTPEDRVAYDLGSGAGLPGIVVAIAAPDLAVRLVETRRKAIAFLELAIAELGLPNAVVVPRRAEDLADPADLCFARAVASIARSWELAAPVLHPRGRLVYFAGRRGRVPTALPLATSVRTVENLRLETSGPLVIITRE